MRDTIAAPFRLFFSSLRHLPKPSLKLCLNEDVTDMGKWMAVEPYPLEAYESQLG